MKQKSLASRILPLGGSLVAACLLVACGGGSSPTTGSVSVAPPITGGNSGGAADFTVMAGQPLVIPGSVHTDLNLLKTMAWSAGVASGSSSLVLSNDKCGVATKADRPIAGSQNGSTGSSDWSCNLGVGTPADITTDTYFTVGLSATDDKSKNYSQTYTLRVTPNAAYLAANAYNPAGPDFTVKSGGTANLSCSGNAQSSYQWVVVDGAGYNIVLSSTNSAASSFTAPIVRVGTPVKLACRITDKNNIVTSSNVTVTVQPPSVVTGNDAGPNYTVKSGQSAPLYCQGPASSTYSWSVVSNSGYPITLANYRTQQTSFVTPGGLTADATNIVLQCSVADASNVVTQSNVTVTVVPATTDSTAAGVAFNVNPGQTAPLFCSGQADSKYQWAITKNPAGLPIALSSYAAQQSSFVAPTVTTDAAVTLTCTESRNGSVANQSSVVVTVKGTSGVATTSALLAKITGSSSGLPGQTLSYTAASGWFDATGTATTGPVITNTWSLGASAPAGFSLSNTTGSSTTLFVPSTQTTAVYVPLTLTSTSGSSSSSTTMSILVDPNSTGFVPTVTPPAQTVKSGNTVSLAVSGGTNQMFYQWTIVSGPVVPLGGATTANVGFVAPTVGAATTMTLRAQIGYAPITVSNPGLYTVDAVVTVVP